MKLFLNLLTVFSLLSLAHSQVLTGAKQCVECQYWGGNWCPTSAYTGAPSSISGVCRSDIITSCTTAYATSPSMCLAVTGHSTRIVCDGFNLNAVGNFSNNYLLPALSFCVLNVTVTANDGQNLALGGGIVSLNSTTNLVLLKADIPFNSNFDNVTQSILVMGSGNAAIKAGLQATASVLIWNTGSTSLTI